MIYKYGDFIFDFNKTTIAEKLWNMYKLYFSSQNKNSLVALRAQYKRELIKYSKGL